jgi:hypothetical protein
MRRLSKSNERPPTVAPCFHPLGENKEPVLKAAQVKGQNMRVMVLVKASKESESGMMPIRQKMAEMGKFNDELVKAGIMLVAEGLKPSSTGVRVRFSGKDRIVTDGPFAETKELVAGYWIWQVKSMEEAITWVKRCPNPMAADLQSNRGRTIRAPQPVSGGCVHLSD